MQKNWYIIYTRPKCEKKVAAILRKKKIENLLPLNNRTIEQGRKSKVYVESLFPSYVFANANNSELELLCKIDNVVSLVYWKGEPATVSIEEIDYIKEFVSYHQNIKLETIHVNGSIIEQKDDEPSYEMDGNVLTIKNRYLKVHLPSIGYTLVADVKTDEMLNRETIFGKKDLVLQ